MKKRLDFEAYAVKIGIASNRPARLESIRERLSETLPTEFKLLEDGEIEHSFHIREKRKGTYEIFKNGEKFIAGVAGDARLTEIIESQIRLTVAEFAVGKVFLHAGAVGWRGRAIIIPAGSFAGKTTLVAELIRKGAVYYSDEYAVIDKDGLVHPFAKTLSMRGIIDDYKQVEQKPESFGAAVGSEPLPVGMILISRFDKNRRKPEIFSPEILSAGQGIIETLAHSLSIRENPKFVLEVLKKICGRAIIAKSTRGEAEIFAARLIEYLNKQNCFEA